MRRDYCEGTLLRLILLTRVLDDSFAYEVTRIIEHNKQILVFKASASTWHCQKYSTLISSSFPPEKCAQES